MCKHCKHRMLEHEGDGVNSPYECNICEEGECYYFEDV